MKKSLVIVQDVPTQFDVPLYNQIADDGSFSLLVIYTQVATEDAEIGRMPQWNHIKEHRYQHHFLNDLERESSPLLLARVFDVAPDHVIVSGYWPKLHRDVMHGLRRRGVSVGLRSDNTIRHSALSGLRGLVKRFYLSRLLTHYNVWHPVGRQAADYLIHLAAEVKPVSFFSYNVDNRWFRKHASVSRAERVQRLAEVGFPEQSFVVLGVMKWAEREDPMTLLKAFEQYRSHNPKARLILIGDGPLKAQVNEMAQKLETYVHTPGYASYSSLPNWYGLADVFVHPAPREPWGVSVSEALASGVPVIASTGVGAAIEQVTEGDNGLIFEQCNVASLVNALKKWQTIAESKTSEEIVRLCHRALNKWNYETTIRSFEAVMNDD